MSKIFEEFNTLVNSRPHYKARGFINIDCPACGDKKKRGGFAATPTGGFRYHCFNGGCEYNIRPTGWETGNGLYGRVRALFDILGGNINVIPMEERRIKNTGAKKKPRLETATRFSETPMPPRSIPLLEAAENHQDARDCVEYLNSRSPMLLESGFPFMWSKRNCRFVLMPYLHFGKIVGYMGRSIDKQAGVTRFIQRVSPDYMFNQHLLAQGEGDIIVMESPMDSVMFNSLGTRDNRISSKQVNLIKLSDRDPILVPDVKDSEWEPYMRVAEANKWWVSVPEWPRGIKDPGEAVKHRGLLMATQDIISAKTKQYAQARARLRKKS